MNIFCPCLFIFEVHQKVLMVYIFVEIKIINSIKIIYTHINKFDYNITFMIKI